MVYDLGEVGVSEVLVELAAGEEVYFRLVSPPIDVSSGCTVGPVWSVNFIISFQTPSMPQVSFVSSNFIFSCSYSVIGWPRGFWLSFMIDSKLYSLYTICFCCSFFLLDQGEGPTAPPTGERRNAVDNTAWTSQAQNAEIRSNSSFTTRGTLIFDHPRINAKGLWS